MIEEIFKLIIFFCISIIYFYSVSGYGKVLSNRFLNFFDLQLEGTIILLIIGYFLYLTIGISTFFNILILSFGLIFYFYTKKVIPKIEIKKILLLFFLIFSVLIISKTHEDFNGYHFFSINEVFNNKLRIGVSNLNERFFHSSHLILNQALTVLPFVNFKFVHLPVYVIYISTIGYFISLVFSKYTKGNELFFAIFCILVLLIKFNRLSEFGYDYIVQFILLIIFHKIYYLNFNKEEISKAILYFTLCVLIKPISLFFLPIMFFILYKNGLTFYKNFSLSRYIIFLLLITTIISSSFFKTGCLFYPLNSTCLSKEKIFWSEKKRIKEYSQMASLWAKSYYNQDNYDKGSKYKKIEDKELYLKNFNWIKFWIETHFFYKISEFLLILLFSFFLIYFYFFIPKPNLDKKSKEKYIVLLLSFLSIIFWLNTAPQFRFGFSSIIVFIFFIFNIFLNLDIKFSKNKFVHLFILGLLVLNIKNFKRINNEFLRDDFYKFTDFPFFNEMTIKNDYSKLKRDKFYHIEILK